MKKDLLAALVVILGFLALIGQVTKDYPKASQGIKGYAKEMSKKF